MFVGNTIFQHIPDEDFGKTSVEKSHLLSGIAQISYLRQRGEKPWLTPCQDSLVKKTWMTPGQDSVVKNRDWRGALNELLDV